MVSDEEKNRWLIIQSNDKYRILKVGYQESKHIVPDHELVLEEDPKVVLPLQMNKNRRKDPEVVWGCMEYSNLFLKKTDLLDVVATRLHNFV